MNTLCDEANDEDFEALRKAVVRKCYNVCMDLAQARYDEYKGRGTFKPNNVNRANPHTEGMSDGATECAAAILEAFRLTEKDL